MLLEVMGGMKKMRQKRLIVICEASLQNGDPGKHVQVQL